MLLTSLIPSSVQTITREDVAIPTAHAQAVEIAPEFTIDQKIDNYASKWNISSTTLHNLALSESGLNATSTNGDDRGIVQINKIYHPEITDAEAFDTDFSLNYAAEQISKGKESEWVACDCASFVKVMLAREGYTLPRIIDAGNLDINSRVPVKGGVVILAYPQAHHIAFIKSIDAEGIHIVESNFQHCLIGSRVLSPSDPHIMGYYDPSL